MYTVLDAHAYLCIGHALQDETDPTHPHKATFIAGIMDTCTLIQGDV